MEHWTNECWVWRFPWRRPLRAWEEDKLQQLEKSIKDKKLVQDADATWSWRLDARGKYTARSAYKQLAKKDGNRLLDYKKLWGAHVPSKVSAFTWQLLLDRIPVKVNLTRHGIIEVNQDINCF
ncbi:hypothetical protein SLE2022_221290 [Rubroshorea leprosula]